MQEKRQEYLNIMYSILKIPNDKEKLERFIQIFTSYSKFCYQHGLSTYDMKLFHEATTLYIIPCTPLEYQIDNVQKEKALNRLATVLENRKQGLLDGIEIADAQLILNATIQNARKGLANGNPHFFEDCLEGTCGLSQSATVFPLQQLDIKVTINNTKSLPDCNSRHSFATCILPIKEENQVSEKQFLLDATYRPFFLAIFCNEGRYYEGDSRFKDTVGPSAGYYVCQTPKGTSFATELLTKGYLELTEETAQIYGRAFSKETISFKTSMDDLKRIQNHTGKEYLEAINDQTRQEQLDYTQEELIKYGFNINLYNDIGPIQNESETKGKEQ